MRRVLFVVGCMVLSAAASAQVLDRAPPVAGSIVQTRSGEEAQLVPDAAWRAAVPRQDLKTGDVLRTNAVGALAVVFADQTQIRLGRNTSLVVTALGPGAATRFSLEEGSLWARAPRGQSGLVIDTPAASAAVRGTDWTLTVEGDRTSLQVLEGAIEFSNPQGSLTVTAGEAAVARIGEAPSKVIVVARSDREQLQYYLSLRDTFRLLPFSPRPTAELRAAAARVDRVPPAERTGADWLDAAEVGLALRGTEEGRAALAEARARPLTAEEAARAAFLAATLAGTERRWEDAAALFAQAAPRLDPDRRAVAIYGAFFARALADPSAAVTPPSAAEVPDTPGRAVAEAFIATYFGDFERGLAILREAEARHPAAAILPATRAELAIVADRRDEAREALERALALDPEDANALRVRGRYRADVEGDLEAAVADLRASTALAPADSGAWNDLALVESGRGAVREADRAVDRAIAEDPNDPVPRANAAILLLDQSRVDEAEAQIEAALAADPTFPQALLARGRLRLQTGRPEEALQDLLAASAANPLYANGLLALAIAYYERGAIAPARQQLDAADRLDPNDPVTALGRAALALDQYEADEAIRSAREAVRRHRARGGNFAALATTREGGSTLADSFRLLGLESWAQYYGDTVFDRFTSSGYFDTAINTVPNPFQDDTRYDALAPGDELSPDGFSILLQGVLLDPLAVASRQRSLNFFRAPFVETTVGGGPILADGGTGATASVEVQAFSNHPFPVSVLASGTFSRDPSVRENDEVERLEGLALVGAQPAPYTSLVAFALSSDTDARQPGAINTPTLEDFEDTRSTLGGLAVAHTLGHRNVVEAFAAVTHATVETRQFRGELTPEGPVLALEDQTVEQLGGLGGVAHMVGLGAVDLSYGVEGGVFARDLTAAGLRVRPGRPIRTPRRNLGDETALGRAYVDALAEVTPTVRVQAGLGGVVLEGGEDDLSELEPRAGVAWAPVEGHWLRAGLQRDLPVPLAISLQPQTVVGLQPFQTSTGLGSTVDAAMLRWDAEWHPRLFTSVEYQHQTVSGLSLTGPASLDTLAVDARIDRLQATANVWLGGGFGLSATYARSWSEITDDGVGGLVDGQALPYLAHQFARGTLTYVHPSRVRVSLSGTVLGERTAPPPFGVAGAFDTALDDAVLADAVASWESADRRLELSAEVYNIFNTPFDIAPDVPGWGRTAVLRGEVRF